MNKNSLIIKEQVLRPLYEQMLADDIVEVRGSRTVELLNHTVTFSSDGDGIIA